jgi:trehalose/maltose transport system permease protein
MRAKSSLSRTRLRSAWFFLAPMMIVLALVAGWPLLRTIYFSFTNANLTDL